MGLEIKIELDESLSEHVREFTGDGNVYGTVEQYIADLIQDDIDRRRHEFEAVGAELLAAFAEPESNYRYVTAEDVIARNKLRG